MALDAVSAIKLEIGLVGSAEGILSNDELQYFLDKNNQYNETIDVLNRRIRMVGMSINSLGYFYSLNKIRKYLYMQ